MTAEEELEKKDELIKRVKEENEKLKAKIKGFENGDVAWQGDMDMTIEQNLELKKRINELKAEKEHLKISEELRKQLSYDNKVLEEQIENLEKDKEQIIFEYEAKIKALEKQIKKMMCCTNCKYNPIMLTARQMYTYPIIEPCAHCISYKKWELAE